MKKILYIGYQSLSLKDSGGALGCIRNHNSLIHLYGEEHCDTIVLNGTSNPSIMQKIHNNLVRIIKKLPFPINVLNNIDFNCYDTIFIDSSRLGSLAKIIRHKGYKGTIIVFFHNFDYRFVNNFHKKGSILKKWINTRVSLSNEKDAISFSNYNIILNERDAREMRDFYHLKNEYLIPVSLYDRYCKNMYYKSPYKNVGKQIFLFVGSYFFGNIEGLNWFMEKIYPFVNIQFVIVGKNMNFLKSNPLYNNVEIYSDVPDIIPFIIHADCMLMPLIGGSGMKIKTCEALMFGKNIIGTKEAFEGFDVDTNLVGKCCDNANDFINAINNFKMPSFNNYAREVFLAKYSFQATLKQFKQLLDI